jgi:hypothetical protein
VTTFDKVLHTIGGGAATAIALCAANHVTLPVWASIGLAVIAFGAGASASQPPTIATFLTKKDK